MFDRLKTWLGGSPAPAVDPLDASRARFRAALHRYPVHVAPNRGFAQELSPEQAQANLDWFIASLPTRLGALRALLADFELYLPAPEGLSLPEAEALMAELIAWTQRCWPATPYWPEHLQDSYWLHCDRLVDDAIFSVALDLGSYFGQIAIAAQPAWRWGLDLSAASLRGPMLSARRVLLSTAPLGKQQVREQLDWEALVVQRYREPQHFLFKGQLADDAWMTQLRDACTGRLITHFQQS